MKNWLKKNRVLLLAVVIGLICAIVYRDSFFSPFFQDDKYHLSLVNQGNPLQVIKNFPYRPISLQLFYTLGWFLFGNNVFGFHLLLFLVFVTSLVFVYKLALHFLTNPEKSLVCTFIYALNISIFANFYWVAVSYFVFAALFLFSSFYFYVQLKKFSLVSIVLFALALLSNEIAVVFPLILLGHKIIFNDQKFRKTLPYLIMAGLFLVFRYFVVGLPKSPDYELTVSLQSLATLRWYILRASNLPEGVNRSQGLFIWLAWALQMGILIFSVARSKIQRLKIVSFAVVWFLAGALPFFFLPNHMSSYYLTISLFGTSLLTANYLENRRLIFVFCLVYLALTVFGLDYLSHTHWIILKNTGPIGKF